MSLLRKVPGVGERIQPEIYQKWLANVAGYEQADLEVEKRTLRIRHAGPPVNKPAKSTWQFGQGPTMWVNDGVSEAVAFPSENIVIQPTIVDPIDQSSGLPIPQAPLVPISVDESEVKTFVLQAVSEKTGYPVEMLDLDLDLEADLGIDTVKQAELFATIRSHFDIPRREDLRLSDYNTLTKVIGFMREALAQKSSATPAENLPAAPQVQVSPAKDDGQPAPAASPLVSVDTVQVKEYVLQAVSEKTGYPVEMLDLELDLEADLGIDTVKQAELFATIRTHFEIPRREDLRLSDYNTLTKVIGFMQDALAAKTPPAGGSNDQAAPEAGEAASMSSVTVEVGRVEQLLRGDSGQSITRRLPVPVLRPRLDLCRPSGVKLGENSRVVVIGDQGKTGEAIAKRLRARKVQVELISGLDSEAAARKTAQFANLGTVDGVYFLTALDEEPPLAQMSLEDWKLEVERRSAALYLVLRAIPGEPFLVSATRMGGLHGYEPEGALAPLGGLVSGFTKALAQERPGKLIKVVDFEANASPTDVSSRLVAETLDDSGSG